MGRRPPGGRPSRAVRRRAPASEAARVAERVARRRPAGGAPARAPAAAGAGRAGVEPEPGDHDVGVTGVRVDREPPARPALAPAHEAPRVERALEQPGRVERERDGARAVITATRDKGPVATAVLVRQ